MILPSLLAAVQEGGEGGLTPFSINPGLILWTLIVFIVLLALLWKFGWPAILKSVEERERRIQKQLDEAEKARAEAAQLLEQQRRAIEKARNESQEILAKAKVVATKEREALLAKTREEQDQMLERARREIDAEKEKAILELRKEAVDLAIAAASKLLEEKLDSEADRRLVLDYLASLEQKR